MRPGHRVGYLHRPPVRCGKVVATITMPLNGEPPFVQKPVVVGTDEGDVVETALPSLGPVGDVMCINKSLVVTPGEGATTVTCKQCALDAGWHRSLFTPHGEWLTIRVFDQGHYATVTTQSSHGANR